MRRAPLRRTSGHSPPPSASPPSKYAQICVSQTMPDCPKALPDSPRGMFVGIFAPAALAWGTAELKKARFSRLRGSPPIGHAPAAIRHAPARIGHGAPGVVPCTRRVQLHPGRRTVVRSCTVHGRVRRVVGAARARMRARCARATAPDSAFEAPERSARAQLRAAAAPRAVIAGRTRAEDAVAPAAADHDARDTSLNPPTPWHITQYVE